MNGILDVVYSKKYYLANSVDTQLELLEADTVEEVADMDSDRL